LAEKLTSFVQNTLAKKQREIVELEQAGLQA